MESKLKALKVIELKELLTKAGVTIPAKANKPDLIAKIIETPSALELFEASRGGGNAVKSPAAPAGASTPRPTSTAASRVTSEAPAVQNDLLAPPEPFDWSAGNGPPPTTVKASNPSAKSTSGLETQTTSPNPPSSESKPVSEQTPAEEKHPEEVASTEAAKPHDEDEETKRKRLRAERFGIPFVENKKAQGPKKQQAQSETTGPPTNKPATSKPPKGKQIVSSTILEEDYKLRKRAERFGIKNDNSVVHQPGTGKKRPAPEAEKVDEEELERRRKRAERFGLPVKA